MNDPKGVRVDKLLETYIGTLSGEDLAALEEECQSAEDKLELGSILYSPKVNLIGSKKGIDPEVVSVLLYRKELLEDYNFFPTLSKINRKTISAIILLREKYFPWTEDTLFKAFKKSTENNFLYEENDNIFPVLCSFRDKPNKRRKDYHVILEQMPDTGRKETNILFSKTYHEKSGLFVAGKKSRLAKKEIYAVIDEENTQKKITTIQNEYLISKDIRSLRASGQECDKNKKICWMVFVRGLGIDLSCYLVNTMNLLTDYQITQIFYAILKAYKENVEADGYVHFDLKPENIIIYSANGEFFAHIIDYDLSRKYEQPVGCRGTEGYIADELKKLEQNAKIPATKKMDYYSLWSMVLYMRSALRLLRRPS